jgi:hypothetical protein
MEDKIKLLDDRLVDTWYESHTLFLYFHSSHKTFTAPLSLEAEKHFQAFVSILPMLTSQEVMNYFASHA